MSDLPSIYLVEPYNAYAPKNRKKHWTEIVEEQALLERIIAEAKSNTLPPNAPNTSLGQPGVVGQGQGQTGGGGVPFVAFFAPRMSANFLVSTTTASAPVSYLFSNTSNPDLLAQGSANFLWNFGDGTTSTDVNPVHNYVTTGSNFSVTLLVTAIATNATASTTQSLNITAPTVSANFTVSSSLSASTSALTQSLTASAGNVVVIHFNNLTSTNNAANNINYLWTFGSGSATSSLAQPPDFTYTATGSYTVRLTATGSFNIAASSSKQAILIVS